ncbi:O-linked N-acetylglucosamine transferase, SPINDLY family protein [Arenibaculum pallidiluteum]|uniref:O-linked N-acetylglucosamine transferase, SPINDLY family protein n=1 Tax=Arenibaculum pallidiluteum TaxID=2812559 RepID=UPI001A972F82|nr:tetratricopeptide repeat protein [Arenibaculum pallidiluteum]
MAIWAELRRRAPRAAETLALGGVLLKESGAADAAVPMLRQALRLDPGHGTAARALMDALEGLGDMAGAQQAGREALAFSPADPELWGALGGLPAAADQSRALAYCRRAVLIDPDSAPARLRLSFVLDSGGQADAAAAAARGALVCDPALPAAFFQLVQLALRRGEPEQAARHFLRLARLAPGALSSRLCVVLGETLRRAGKPELATAVALTGIAALPEEPRLLVLLGTVRAIGDHDGARAALEAALIRDPANALALNAIGLGRSLTCEAERAVTALRRAVRADPSDPQVHSNLLLTLQYSAAIAPDEKAALHMEWGRRHGAPEIPERPARRARDRGGRLRVGYLSPDFYAHPVVAFLEPVLAHHDRGRFQVFCYSTGARDDAVTERLRGRADVWREIRDLPDAEVAQRIAEDGIDVLVDLAGHTGGNRLPVFARRPAPVQVNWLGYPDTTGLRAMDYRLTDAVADPPGLADARHAETLWRMPGCFLCFGPPADAPAVAPLPSLERGFVTFGSFNNLAKLNENVAATWAEILHAVPESRLLLKAAALANAGTRARVLGWLAVRGIAADRVDLLTTIASAREHLGLYGAVDVALDPFPYNGTTTTCEAAWMGVPTVTLLGGTHVARVGASLNAALGLERLVAPDAAAYRGLAVSLACDLPALQALRAGLRPRMAASRLCDAAAFTRSLEEAYAAMLARARP